MNRILTLLMMIVLSASMLNAQANDTEVCWGSEDLLSNTFDSIRIQKDIAVAEVKATNMSAVLARLKAMPKLQTLKLYDCDLAGVNEKSPVPGSVKSVLIVRGKLSQGTLRWLAQFPKGNELVFGADVRGLAFDDLGKLSWPTFDNCTISPAAVVKLVAKLTQVTFKEVTLAENK